MNQPPTTDRERIAKALAGTALRPPYPHCVAMADAVLAVLPASAVPPVDLLRRAESYLSALHGSVARHDNLGVNLGCAGCELRDQLGAELRRQAVEEPAPLAEFELRGTAEIRTTALLEGADALGRMDYDTDSNDYGYDTYRDAWNGGVMDGAGLLRGLAAEERDEQEAQANLDQLAEDLAAAVVSCPGRELSPSPCRCPCYGCKHHCAAHDPSRLAAEEQPDNETPDRSDRAVLARVGEWVTSDVVTARNEFGNGYREAQRDIRDLLGGAPLSAVDAPPAFVTRVLELFSVSHADAYGDLFWTVDSGAVRLHANVSDVFAWGGSDCEPITPDTLPALEQAYTDLKAVGAEEFTAELYAARQRGMRPQGAAYPSGTHESWRKVSALYDACGPEREVGLGNPKAPPTAAAPPAVVPQPEEA